MKEEGKREVGEYKYSLNSKEKARYREIMKEESLLLKGEKTEPQYDWENE